MKKISKIWGSMILSFAMLISLGSTSETSVSAKTIFNEKADIKISEIGGKNLTQWAVDDEIHEVEYDGDYKYELDLVVVDSSNNNAMKTATSTSNEQKKYAIGTFKCYYKNTTWVFTGNLQAHWESLMCLHALFSFYVIG